MARCTCHSSQGKPVSPAEDDGKERSSDDGDDIASTLGDTNPPAPTDTSTKGRNILLSKSNTLAITTELLDQVSVASSLSPSTSSSSSSLDSHDYPECQDCQALSKHCDPLPLRHLCCDSEPPSKPVPMTCCSLVHTRNGNSDCTQPQRGSGPDTRPQDSDAERGTPSFERVVLTIDGLKCGCCGGGISRAIEHIPAIKNHQVNIVLARVEFDLDITLLSVVDVIKRLNGATGFTFEEYHQPEGQILEFLVSDPAEMLAAGKPSGVTLIDCEEKQLWSPIRILSGRSSVLPVEAHRQDKPALDGFNTFHARPTSSPFHQHIVRIHYDARTIGARDVFEFYQQRITGHKIELAPPAAHPSLAIGRRQTKRASVVFLMALLLTVPVLVIAWAPINHLNLVYAHVSMALATAVQMIAIKEFVPGALRSLVHSGLFEMDFLITLSTTTAYVFSIVSYVFRIQDRPLEIPSFFETSTLLVTLILLGRVISEFARFSASKSVSFRSLQVDDALLVLPGAPQGTDPETRKIDARLLQYGDSFKIPPHTRVVTDGKVQYGGSEVDESMITGESIPVAKGLGQKVYAGTTNGDGQLIVLLTALPHENAISKIAMMVENAELSKPKVQALADRIAGWFVPVMIVIGWAVFMIWTFVGRYHNHWTWRRAIINAVTYAVATLIVSCPCAIGLAVPMVILIAGGVSARFGIIFRDPQKLEVARNVTDVIFDKTGTLTTGNLTVIEGTFQGFHSGQAAGVLLGLLKDVKHPVAQAVCSWIKERLTSGSFKNIRPTEIVNITSSPGEGVMGTCKDSLLEVRAGNPQWLGVEVLESDHTLLCLTISGVLSATFRLQDRPRYTAELVVKRLHQRGLDVHMISGDTKGAVRDIAHSLNIPKTHTQWRLKPEDKHLYVQSLQNSGKVVMFVGDGANDSVALKQSDVGVHMNHGSDVAKGASDVILMTTRLHDLLILQDISKAAFRRIALNFTWSAIYNILAILMAAGAFVKIRIEPAWAGLGELVSVVPVILIAFQMKWRSYGDKYRAMEYDYLKE